MSGVFLLLPYSCDGMEQRMNDISFIDMKNNCVKIEPHNNNGLLNHLDGLLNKIGMQFKTEKSPKNPRIPKNFQKKNYTLSLADLSLLKELIEDGVDSLHIVSGLINIGENGMIIEKENPEFPYKLKCISYVFWKAHSSGKINLLPEEYQEVERGTSTYYLLDKYFEPALFPEEGDIAVYSTKESRSASKSASYAHFGIYRGEGKIESKWEDSPFILVHDLEDVPEAYGNEICYYRPRSISVNH